MFIINFINTIFIRISFEKISGNLPEQFLDKLYKARIINKI